MVYLITLNTDQVAELLATLQVSRNYFAAFPSGETTKTVSSIDSLAAEIKSQVGLSN